ncbi:MAG: MATE family efflux transporter [Tissierellia bacterium]|nr:MATE family efflux transporter [Tissierellia bacterium]
MVLRSKFFHYMIPSVIAMWVFSIYTIVDGFFVANYTGVHQLAAVNLSTPFVTFLFAIAILFAVGAQTIIGILLGRGERNRANQLFTFTTVFILFFSILLTIVCQIHLDKIIVFLGAEEEYFSYAQDYLHIILYFAPFFILSYTFEVLVKIDGYPLTSIVGVLAASVCNIVLDYLFIARFQWDVKGAALATGLAQVLSAILFFLHFRMARGYLRFTSFSLQKQLRHLKTVLFIGFGEAISEMNQGVILFIFNLFILKFLGDQMIAPFAVINYISLLVSVTFAGIIQGAQPLISYYYGAKEKKKYLKIIKYSLLCVLISSLVFYALVFLFSHHLLGLFLEDPILTAKTVAPLRQFGLIFLLAGYSIFVAGAASAINRPKYSILINSCRGALILIPSLIFTIFVLGRDFFWYAAILSETINFILSLFVFRKLFLQK